jgi:putative flippase GtrA
VKRYLQTFANRTTAVQAVKVALVGVANTVVSITLFNVFLALGISWFVSVSMAFVLTTFMSYVVNRRWTFDLTDGRVSTSETASFFAVNGFAYLATIGIMGFAEALFGPLDTLGYNAALAVAAGLLILPKLAGYRDVVFSRALGERAVGSAPAPAPVDG